MRLDQLLPLLGVVKRRTIAKRLADSGLISVNDSLAKAGKTIKAGDTIHIGGNASLTIRVTRLPGKSLSKEERPEYFEAL